MNNLKDVPMETIKGNSSLAITVIDSPLQGIMPANLTWIPNIPFVAILEFTGNLVGKGGGRFEVRDPLTGSIYNIFPRDMARYVAGGLVKDGQIAGTWEFVKRNTAYGIQRI